MTPGTHLTFAEALTRASVRKAAQEPKVKSQVKTAATKAREWKALRDGTLAALRGVQS